MGPCTNAGLSWPMRWNTGMGKMWGKTSILSGAKSLTASHVQLPRKLVNALMPVGRHDERVAEEHAQRAVGRDRVGFDHQGHAGLQLEVRLGVVDEDMRLGAGQVQAVDQDRP